MKNNFFLNFFIFIILVGVGLVFYSKYFGIKGIVVKEYNVKSEILTENFSGLKIVHFSDLLYKSTIDQDDVNELIEKINILNPNIVVFTGDLFNKNVKFTKEDEEFLIESLSKINANIGKYSIYGDYDYNLDSYEKIMLNSNFKILNNSFERIYYGNSENMYIVGLPSSIKENINLDKSFKFYDDEDRKYTICLIHDGNTINSLNESNYEIDLILGGHSLNGSVVIPFYGSLFIDKYSSKYYAPTYTKGITKIYISSGLGTNKYSYRFNNKPSFNLYRLKAQS